MGGPKTPQKRAGIPFLDTTWNLVKMKAYIDQIRKWYVTEIFSAALLPTEALKIRARTSQRYASIPSLGAIWNFNYDVIFAVTS